MALEAEVALSGRTSRRATRLARQFKFPRGSSKQKQTFLLVLKGLEIYTYLYIYIHIHAI